VAANANKFNATLTREPIEMKEIKIKVPDVAHIVISGPTQCGKSIVMDTIEKALKSEFGANVVSEDLRIERNANDYESMEDWQKKMVAKTTWVLSEANG